MRKYACDVCGLTFNDYGHFENGKPCAMYELQMVFCGSGEYEGNIICHRCFEKMLINGRREKDINGSGSLGSCAECKYKNKAPHEEPCKICSHSFMNHFEPKEDPEDVPSEQ